MNFDDIRKDFPYFNNQEAIYLDSAATTQKPQIVIDSISEYYSKYNANANRGSYKTAWKSTQILEDSRNVVRKFIDAKYNEEIIFTKSATESLNLIAYSYGLKNLKEGGEVLVSIAEHHANFVNWQFICEKTGAKFRTFGLDENRDLDIEDFKSKLNSNTKVVAITAQSNVLSFEVDIKQISDLAHEYGAIVVVDGCQLISHKKISVIENDIDFFAFSGHKAYSLQGVGVLYGKRDILENMDPFLLGGDMVEYVTEEKSSFKELPHKFEAGTLDIGAIYSLKIAIEYLKKIGFEYIQTKEEELIKYTRERLNELDFIEILYKGKASNSLITFNVKGVHPHDVSQILDFENINIRVGHHCAQALHRYMGINSSCRISVAFYNDREDIDKAIEALKKVKETFYGN